MNCKYCKKPWLIKKMKDQESLHKNKKGELTATTTN